MGLLSKLFGRRKNDRIEMVREVAKLSNMEAMRHDALTQYSERDILFIDKMGPMEVMTLPDATVLTILEQFISLVKSGMSDKEALIRIEDVRNTAVVGKEHFPLNFIEYIYYRINIEHGSGVYDRLNSTIKAFEYILLKSTR